MRKLLRSTLIVPQTYLLFVLTVSVATSTQAQTRTTADKPDEQSRALSFLPRYKLSLSSQSFRIAPAKRKSGGSPSGSLTPMALNLQVLGGGTLGRLTKWTGFTSSNSFIGDSTIFEDKNGNVGIGTDMPTSKLTVNGTIQASGGVSVIHDPTLTGNGTTASPLGVAIPLILKGDAFELVSLVNTADGGDGMTAIGGKSNSSEGGSGVTGFGGNSDSGQGGKGMFARGGKSNSTLGGIGIEARGGPSDSSIGGPGTFTVGGDSSSAPGAGVISFGGRASDGFGGVGVRGIGGEGNGAGNSGGIGIEAIGGAGKNGATPGLAGKFSGDVQITGNTLATSAGKGLILKSPDGATCRLISIDNAGNLVLTAISCP